MRTKLMVICVFISSCIIAQTEDFITYGKFIFADTLSVPKNYSVNPGQLSKDGNQYYLGLYYDGEEDTSFSNIYSIDIHSQTTTPLQITPPEGYTEFFQCSVSDDEKTIVLVANNFKGWAGNDLALAEKDASGKYNARILDELNTEDTVDAYPWLSGDGLRIYFVKNEVIYFSERKNRSEKFNSPAPLVFTNAVQTPIRSLWLNTSEKKLFYISNNIIYVAERKKISKPFKLPEVFTKEFINLEFIASLSFTPNMNHLYLYYSGENTKILHYKMK